MSESDQRLVALGEELVKLHNGFRHDLAELRAGAEPGPRLGEHCLAFCESLDLHHRGEEDVLFPHLGERHPELAQVLDRLSTEHRTVARILAAIRALVRDGEPVAVGTELDRLAGELEAHLDYEEEQLVPVLNQLTELPEGL